MTQGTCKRCYRIVHRPCQSDDESEDCPNLREETDPENIYGLPSMRQSVEEDRAKRGR